MKITSCHKCPDRHPACHDTCERYQSQLKEHIAQSRKIRDERREEVEFIKLKNESITYRLRKKQGRV